MATGSTTTITLNKGFANKLKKSGVKVLKVSPATVKGNVITMPVLEGSLDPTTGQGTLVHEGGIKFKKGSKNISLKELILETATSTLTAKVGSKKMKLATVGTLVNTRNGFGTTVAISSMKLTNKAAKELNKKLGFSSKPKKNKKQNKRASASKTKKKPKPVAAPFKANQNLGSSSSAVQPKTVVLLETGSASLATNETTVKKFEEAPPTGLGVKIVPIAPTTVSAGATPNAPILNFPIGNEDPTKLLGNIAPNGLSGVPQTKGGVELVQNLGPAGESKIVLGNIWLDMATLKATANVVVTSNVGEEPGKPSPANLGPLGRSSIAKISLAGATITSDPAAHTVSVQNASASFEASTALVLNEVFGGPYKAMEIPHPEFAEGDPLGTFSFVATTQ